MLREIKTKNTLYKVNQMYGSPYFVEASSKEELFIFIADKVLKGAIINSVTEVRLDGSTPKVRVLSDKEFKKILKNTNPYMNKHKKFDENPYSDFIYLNDTNNAVFGDSNKLELPKEPVVFDGDMDCSLDELEVDCWELIKDYATLFDCKIVPNKYSDENDISYDVAKSLQNSIIQMFRSAGVKFVDEFGDEC